MLCPWSSVFVISVKLLFLLLPLLLLFQETERNTGVAFQASAKYFKYSQASFNLCFGIRFKNHFLSHLLLLLYYLYVFWRKYSGQLLRVPSLLMLATFVNHDSTHFPESLTPGRGRSTETPSDRMWRISAAISSCSPAQRWFAAVRAWALYQAEEVPGLYLHSSPCS